MSDFEKRFEEYVKFKQLLFMEKVENELKRQDSINNVNRRNELVNKTEIQENPFEKELKKAINNLSEDGKQFIQICLEGRSTEELVNFYKSHSEDPFLKEFKKDNDIETLSQIVEFKTMVRLVYKKKKEIFLRDNNTVKTNVHTLKNNNSVNRSFDNSLSFDKEKIAKIIAVVMLVLFIVIAIVYVNNSNQKLYKELGINGYEKTYSKNTTNDSLNLVIKALSKTEITVTIDKAKKIQRRLLANDEVKLTAKEQFNLVSSNISSIEVHLNDKYLRIPYSNSKNLVITKEGFIQP